MIQRKSKPVKRLKPIPFKLVLHLTFLPEDLSDHAYEQEVRKLVREKLPTLEEERDAPAFFQVYDDRISAIIEDELARN